MGLTLACRRSAIIDFTVNEGCGVYRLRAKEEQQGQTGLVEKIPEIALPCSNSDPHQKGGRPTHPWSLWKSVKVENCLGSCASISSVCASSGGRLPRVLMSLVISIKVECAEGER